MIYTTSFILEGGEHILQEALRVLAFLGGSLALSWGAFQERLGAFLGSF